MNLDAGDVATQRDKCDGLVKYGNPLTDYSGKQGDGIDSDIRLLTKPQAKPDLTHHIH